MAMAASQPSSGSAPASGAPAAPSTSVLLTEVPVSLKQLARLVVRGFYPVEEALIVDMLVRYPCVREEDLAGKFLFCRQNHTTQTLALAYEYIFIRTRDFHKYFYKICSKSYRESMHNKSIVLELLKFDRKMLRARISTLKSDKFLQVKQRIETDEEGKVVKMNCYYINFKVFVNIVKYKLDLMRKKMETSERDATSRDEKQIISRAIQNNLDTDLTLM